MNNNLYDMIFKRKSFHINYYSFNLLHKLLFICQLYYITNFTFSFTKKSVSDNLLITYNNFFIEHKRYISHTKILPLNKFKLKYIFNILLCIKYYFLNRL